MSEEFALGRSYPNPFNAEVAIPFQVARAGRVRLEIFNLVGQRVRLLVDEERPVGFYRMIWDGRDGAGRAVASGVYFYRLQAGERTASRRMLLLK